MVSTVSRALEDYCIKIWSDLQMQLVQNKGGYKYLVLKDCIAPGCRKSGQAPACDLKVRPCGLKGRPDKNTIIKEITFIHLLTAQICSHRYEYSLRCLLQFLSRIRYMYFSCVSYKPRSLNL